MHLDSLRDAGATEVLAGAIRGEVRLDSIAQPRGCDQNRRKLGGDV